MTDTRLLFGIDERPPMFKSLTAAVAHLLAIVGGIATAPLIIARGLNLDVALTTYVVASALVISGIATFIQIRRFGPMGSGVLSVQGTSFAFVGVFIYAGINLQSAGLDNEAVLGTLIGTAAVGGSMTIVLSFFLRYVSAIVTLNVAGITVFLLGLSLVWVAWGNLGFAVAAAKTQGSNELWVYLQAVIVIGVITFFSTRSNPWLKLSSIMLGLFAGMVFAGLTNSFDQPFPTELAPVFLIEFLPFALHFDGMIFLLLAPIFLVSTIESIGDLTATSLLSGRSVSGPDYWLRLRGGVMADGFNTLLAGLFGTFPNTTFSQNNGVIRLTGVASRFVGLLMAILLILLGSIPWFSALFRMLPGGVLHGATGLMFGLIMLTGFRVLRTQPNQPRVLLMLVCCTLGAISLTQTTTLLANMGVATPAYVQMLTNFPVASGALIAMTWEGLALLISKFRQTRAVS
ncbi:MAG: xanthine permease XanP [Candidatus Pseudothioglobus sp.]